MKRKLGFSLLLVVLLVGVDFFLAAGQAALAKQRLVIVANNKFPLDSIESTSLRRIFLKKLGRISGVALHPCNLKRKTDARSLFENNVLRMSPTRLKRLWLKNRLAGLAKPPVTARNVKSLISYLSKNKGAISYLLLRDWEKVGSNSKSRLKKLKIFNF
ncbi:MAG: hypothetical protein ACE5GM_02575 [bacterium]